MLEASAHFFNAKLECIAFDHRFGFGTALAIRLQIAEALSQGSFRESASQADILLASSSTAGKSVKQMGLTFDVMSPDVAESVMPDEAPHAYVERLSRSSCGGARAGSNQVVIAANCFTRMVRFLVSPQDLMTANKCYWRWRGARIGC